MIEIFTVIGLIHNSTKERNLGSFGNTKQLLSLQYEKINVNGNEPIRKGKAVLNK